MDEKTLDKKVRVTPVGSLRLNASNPTSVKLKNESDRVVAFKLRCTRATDVKPTVFQGVLKPNGGEVEFKVHYRPSPTERSFIKDERLVIVIREMPADATDVKAFWKGQKDARAEPRIVLQLLPPDEGESREEDSDDSDGQDSPISAEENKGKKEDNNK